MPPPPPRPPQRPQPARRARAKRSDARAQAQAPRARPPRPWQRTAAQAASPARCCAPPGKKTSQPAQALLNQQSAVSAWWRVAAGRVGARVRCAASRLVVRRQRPAMRLSCAVTEVAGRAQSQRHAPSPRCTRRGYGHEQIAAARRQRGARTLHRDGDGECYDGGDERRPRRARRQLSAQRGARGLGASALGATQRRLLLRAGGADWCIKRRRRKARRKRNALGLGDVRQAPPRRREQRQRR